MKRILSIALLSFVLLAGSRMALNLHYCGGELASIEFFPKPKEDCSKCGMKKSKTCCQDVSKVFSSEDHSFTIFTFDFTQQVIALPTSFSAFQWEVPAISFVNRASVWVNAPPSIPKEPRYILFSSLIV